MLNSLGVFSGFFSRSTRRRYESRHVLLAGLARLWGLRVYNRNLYWFTDQEYLQHWNAFPGAGREYSRIHDRRFVLFQLAKAAAKLGHDTAECGVLFGAGSHLICSASRDHGPTSSVKTHFVFDSFEGLSAPAAADVPRAERTLRWQKHDLSVPEEVVRKNLSQFDFVEYLQGWIPDRFNEVKDRRFSLVHVDVDLYQPTLDAFEFFYPRLVPGGLLICDDFGSETCPGAFKAMREFIDDKDEEIIHLTTGQGLVVKLQ